MSACRPWLARWLLAATVNAALLGPLPPVRPRPTAPPIVAVAADRRRAEQIARRRGGVDQAWVLTLPASPPRPSSLN